ncbi:DUF1003 domain-containing protein [Opitutus sp. ER46]|uniref:DUF1003 domain-containing protein n=1 Tax=Opitutus sp. ER46 TaxID=2161864 RepID=UPI000D2F7BDA|nr:DUF1003 domain-containing protein [Opitutus sp. ER46]PTX94581.1 hypothetical protein DB354_12680 [Opitutus sp. ER46]
MPSSPPANVAPVVERNITALLARRQAVERSRTFGERLSDGIGRFAGSIVSVYFHFAVFGSWIVINLGWTPLRPFDPSFVVLAMVTSAEAIFLSTFVLIMQNRLAAISEQRAELDLQISLLAEHEVTRVLQLTSAIADKVGAPSTVGTPEIDQLKQDVSPEHVLDRLSAAENKKTGA